RARQVAKRAQNGARWYWGAASGEAVGGLGGRPSRRAGHAARGGGPRLEGRIQGRPRVGLGENGPPGAAPRAQGQAAVDPALVATPAHQAAAALSALPIAQGWPQGRLS